MQLPQGFFGTRGDILIDTAVASIVAVGPLLVYSWYLARQKRWVLHKRIQITTAIVLAITIGLFEWDLNQQGGIFGITSGGAYEGTFTLAFWIWTHLFFSVSSTLIWLGLILAALWKFRPTLDPRRFPTHRYWGRSGMVAMLGAGLTAIPLYVYGFVL